MRLARADYYTIQKRTPRRQAYIKSKYFGKDKIFIGQFWEHIRQKRPSDRVRRVRLFPCAMELIRHTRYAPDIIVNNELLLYRFYGKTPDGKRFCVQVRESTRTSRKDFMSVFPVNEQMGSK